MILIDIIMIKITIIKNNNNNNINNVVDNNTNRSIITEEMYVARAKSPFCTPFMDCLQFLSRDCDF